MKHTLVLTAAIALLTAVSTPCAQAQERAGEEKPAQMKAPISVSMQDRSFVRQAAAANASEIGCGRLASERASDPGVQQFGRGIVNDHTALDKQLATVARNERIPVPRIAASCDRLRRVTGPGFDQAFLRNERQDHEKAIAFFKKEAQSGQNQGLRGLAQEAVPALQAHLDEANRLLQAPAGGAMGTSRPETYQPGTSQPGQVVPPQRKE